MDDIKSFSPDWSSPPGHTINELAALKGLSTDILCEKLGLSTSCFANLMCGTHPITIDLAAKLQSHVGASTNFWITREGQYRADLLKLTKRRPYAALSEILPLREMAQLGWLNAFRGGDGDIAAAMRFFDIAENDDFYEKYQDLSKALAFRKSPSFDVRIGPLAAWFRAGELQVQNIRCKAWSRDKFAKILIEVRNLTRERDSDGFLSSLQSKCADAGVAVALVSTPRGCPASGAAFFKNESQGVILLSGRHQTDDHFWFNFFHEAGHLLLHCENGQLFLEGESLSDAAREDEANKFAGTLLIPTSHQQELQSLKANKYEIVRFARKTGVSPGIIVGQLQYLGLIRRNQLNFLKRKIVL